MKEALGIWNKALEIVFNALEGIIHYVKPLFTTLKSHSAAKLYIEKLSM